jgi:hypothetical protein
MPSYLLDAIEQNVSDLGIEQESDEFWAACVAGLAAEREALRRCTCTGGVWCDEHNAIPAGRVVALDRDESESCQAGTPGCCIDHGQDEGTCETW